MHRSPGNSSPRFDAGDESGFFIFMAHNELEIISSAFSAQRLSKYLAYNHGDVERTIRHYKSNLRLAESLYISLSVFEVTLRNALSRELRNMAGKDDCFEIFYTIPELAPFVLEIDKAKSLIRNRGEKVNTDKIISEMTFGFWVMLLNSQYERVLWKSLCKARSLTCRRKIVSARTCLLLVTRYAICAIASSTKKRSVGIYIMLPACTTISALFWGG